MYDIMKTKDMFHCLKSMFLALLKKKSHPGNWDFFCFRSRLFPVESNLRAEAMKNFDQIFACVVLVPGIG